VASCVHPGPATWNPYCLRDKPPASVNSNSASLRLVAPKSTTKNDFLFQHLFSPLRCSTNTRSQKTAGSTGYHGKLVVITRNTSRVNRKAAANRGQRHHTSSRQLFIWKFSGKLNWTVRRRWGNARTGKITSRAEFRVAPTPCRPPIWVSAEDGEGSDGQLAIAARIRSRAFAAPVLQPIPSPLRRPSRAISCLDQRQRLALGDGNRGWTSGAGHVCKPQRPTYATPRRRLLRRRTVRAHHAERREKRTPRLASRCSNSVNRRIALLGAENPEPNLNLHVEILDPCSAFSTSGRQAIPVDSSKWTARISVSYSSACAR